MKGIGYDSLVQVCWETRAYRTKEAAITARTDQQATILCVIQGGRHWHNIKRQAQDAEGGA